MTAVSCSIPCPSTSKACGMLPTFAIVNVTVPAAMVRVESSTFHSDSLALTAAGSPGALAPTSATAASSSAAAFRSGTACPYDIAIFLLRECDDSLVRCWRPRAAPGYSARDSLGHALDRVAPEFREVIVLRELEGLSYKEISDVAGVPIGTVMSRLSRARRRLEEALCAD